MLDFHLSRAYGGVTMVGQTVGKYRIVSRLGRGGMGTVYKAVDESLEREVAIKVLNPDLGDPEILQRFRAEAMTLARLNHPNIATLYEFAQHDDDLLMVMEFVRGETFDRVSDRFGPLPFDRAATLCSQVLDALGHAHRARIVHRDSEAGQPDGDRQRPRKGHGLRHRPHRRHRAPDDRRLHDGHARLHGARAGHGQRGRRPRRSLFDGRRAVSAA